jgi:hypothetical protein
MVISISPRGRDSKFNDLATLKIEHQKGKLETPNRIVTKNDYNAKDEIGADIPLTRTSKSFMVQENIDPDILNKILTENGYLNTMLTKTGGWSQKLGNKESLLFLYPHLTKNAVKELDTTIKRKKFFKFFGNLATLLGLESVMLPVIGDVSELTSGIDLNKLQIIPIIDLQDKEFIKKYEAIKTLASIDSPFMGFKFAPYPKANLAYDKILEEFDIIHESKKGVMLVDAERNLKYSQLPNVSGPHYGSFITADLIVERYKAGGGGKTPSSVRLFCKNDLVTIPNNLEGFEKKFDLKEGKKIFQNDKKLNELLEKIVTNKLKKEDWKQNRPSYLSRVHENASTRPEFDKLHDSINKETTMDYLEDRPDMNIVVKDHLKEKFESE